MAFSNSMLGTINTEEIIDFLDRVHSVLEPHPSFLGVMPSATQVIDSETSILAPKLWRACPERHTRRRYSTCKIGPSDKDVYPRHETSQSR